MLFLLEMIKHRSLKILINSIKDDDLLDEKNETIEIKEKEDLEDKQKEKRSLRKKCLR
ncbi:hypothetical protein KBB05_02570 [Patescibacteria group bacterium]|nr:hypothetical protein [Patescibacteria group bacterium]